MVFNVRCYKCGENEVRLVLGGRAIIHARCHGCDSNLLAEIMELEAECEARRAEANSLEGPGTWAGDEEYDDGPSTQTMAVGDLDLNDSEEAIPVNH